MQAISPVTPAQLLAPGQVPLMKVEIYVDPYWVNICDGFSFLLSPCDATTDWTGTALSIDTDDKKEGMGSLKDNVASPVIDTWYHTIYNPIGSWDWSAKKHLLFWLQSDRASTAFATSVLYIWDTLNNYSYWYLTFSAGEWMAVKKLLSARDGGSATPPDLTLVAYVRVSFQAADTTAFYKKIDDLRIDDIAAGLKGKNYLESASVSLGGASMTPNPVGGAWNAMLGNKDSIFHPKHPTSPYKDYCVTGRKARISIGATYGGTDYYWQRMIGFMDEPKFSAPDYKVAISGGDYMKLLQETELRSPDNYWGTSAVFSSIASDGQVGSEIYAEADAMEIGAGEANNVTNWTAVESTFVSFADTGGGSTYVGRVTNITPLTFAYMKNLNVGNATAGKEYKVKFKHRGVGEDGESASIQVRIYQASGLCNRKTYYPTDDWTEDVLYFTALDTGVIEMWIVYTPGFSDLRFDQFSTWEFVSYWKRYYEVSAASKGPYYVTLDGSPVWQGEKDEGWYYAEDAEPGPDPPAHPARIVYFDPNKVVANGTNNLVVYYFTVESPENAVADILVKANLYADRAAALAAMEYTATGITIDKIWFEAGSTCLNAIKKLCERCDYRFFFNYDGKPVFKPKPAPGATSFTFTEQKHIASAVSYQCRDEIKNRIVIEGMKQAEPVNKEETIPPELKGEDFDSTSIGLYGERTLTIKNHLFQSQASIDAMCTSLLAEYKDPKLYADIEVPFRPVPLELSDKISFKERLSPTLEITQEGIIRDIKIDGFTVTYRVEVI